MSGPQQGRLPADGNDAKWRAGHPAPYREVQEMYFHAGQDFVLNTRDVIGVFDLDTGRGVAADRGIFPPCRGRGRRCGPVRPPAPCPKSFMVTDFPDETVYISQLSPAALKSGRKN